ncbi:Response regulator receiver domain-containing protein [Sulfitobacter marinus]|uniref:Response regulator receiver domain-containing protein n=1 Tax=Sulfitobacter marinus TaxID=394264 RepID=A0A1I6VAX6_9RHOB|nr:Response regulator receiver domain-containing protein [Sulfitobacter marinus]
MVIKILHVEDDESIREIVELALEMAGGFEVVQCHSGEDALTRSLDYIPDVLLLDMMMPGLTGRQTLERLRERPEFVEIPAIFMTARAQPNEMDELRQIGAVDVISKPFDPITLGDQIKAVVG